MLSSIIFLHVANATFECRKIGCGVHRESCCARCGKRSRFLDAGNPNPNPHPNPSEAVSFMQDGDKPKNAFKKAGLWYTVTKTAKDYRRVVRRSQRLTGKADKKERQQKLLKVSR